MKKSLIAIVISLVVFFGFSSCTRKATQHFSFAFYNVENLFDTINDPKINDSRYVPDSDLEWDTEKYEHKLDNLAKVMAIIDSTGFPTILGLSEVENINVLKDLLKHPEMIKADYRILHKDSPDERGIDVALLYQAEKYTPIFTDYIQPVFIDDPENKTRDILYSKGLVGKRDTIHLFVNHWVSRWGGQEETEPHRIIIASLIKNFTDSIFRINPQANILIAGDLNDNPNDKSIANYLNAVETVDNPSSTTLYNLSLASFKSGEGSLYYKSWDMFDQIIVSGSLLSGKNGIKTNSNKQTVIKEDWMLYQPKEGPARPSRTAAKNYYGGYSDHLPVFVGMSYQK